MGEDKPESVDALSPAVTGRRLKRKYQVFVSSTYRDLSEERERVVWTILECRQIPVGMESFSATDDRGWKTIQRTIDDTDYYVLLLAGTYGSVDPSTGMSWTQREYEYAVSQRIPVLAFIREPSAITADKVEPDPDKKKKLDALIKRVRESHLCVDWKVADDLSKSVATSLFKQIEDDEGYGSPRSGWVRGNAIPSSAVMDEFARLSADNAKLRVELEKLRKSERTADLQLLIAGFEEPQGEIDFELKGHVVDQIRSSNYFLSAPSRAEIEKYLNELGRLVWLKARIRNKGAAGAQGVVVDYKVSGVENIFFRHDKPNLLLVSGRGKPWQTDPVEAVYIDSISEESVRQRIRQIPPNMDENLVSVGLLVPELEPDSACVVDVEYKVAEVGGAHVVGRILINVRRSTEVLHFKSWDEVP